VLNAFPTVSRTPKAVSLCQPSGLESHNVAKVDLGPLEGARLQSGHRHRLPNPSSLRRAGMELKTQRLDCRRTLKPAAKRHIMLATSLRRQPQSYEQHPPRDDHSSHHPHSPLRWRRVRHGPGLWLLRWRWHRHHPRHRSPLPALRSRPRQNLTRSHPCAHSKAALKYPPRGGVARPLLYYVRMLARMSTATKVTATTTEVTAAAAG
jgi:hypothetical protein